MTVLTLPGDNATISLGSYEGTLPCVPSLGRSLSILQLKMLIPKLHLPGSGRAPDDDEKPTFIKDATVLSPFIEVLSEWDDAW